MPAWLLRYAGHPCLVSGVLAPARTRTPLNVVFHWSISQEYAHGVAENLAELTLAVQQANSTCAAVFMISRLA